MSKKYFILFAILFISRIPLVAQNVYSTSERSSKFYSFKMSIGERVFASDSLNVAMDKYLQKNKTRKVNGYRLRIYFDNSQNARAVSGRILSDFSRHYPKVPIFRIYDNPYWRVTVGNFRSKSEAMKFRREIKLFYPTVFLVKEALSTI